MYGNEISSNNVTSKSSFPKSGRLVQKLKCGGGGGGHTDSVMMSHGYIFLLRKENYARN
jgi:hypothetical protein